MSEEKKETKQKAPKAKDYHLNRGLVFGGAGLYTVYNPSILQWLFSPFIVNSQLALFTALVVTFVGVLYLLNAF